jgi:hypothetical protein
MLVLSVQFIFIHVSSSLYITTFYSISVFSIFCFLGTGMMLTARFMRWSTTVQSVLSSRPQPHTRPKVSIPRRQAVHFLRRLVTCLSARRTGFAPGSVHVGLVVDEVALGQVFLRHYHTTVSPHTHIIWRMNNSPAGGRNSERFSSNRHEQQQTHKTIIEVFIATRTSDLILVFVQFAETGNRAYFKRLT